MLTTHLSEEAIRDAFTACAAAYVTKSAGLRYLRDVLSTIRLRPKRPPQVREPTLLAARLHALAEQRGDGFGMTPQQERVLELAAQGLTSRAIGARLFLSESTVRFHIQKLKLQIGARSRTDLVARAIRLGLIPPVPEDLRQGLN